MSQSVTTPDPIRTEVKLAGSMELCASARRHRTELAANASIATTVRPMVRGLDTGDNPVISFMTDAARMDSLLIGTIRGHAGRGAIHFAGPACRKCVYKMKNVRRLESLQPIFR